MGNFSRESYLAQLLECSPDVLLVGIATDLKDRAELLLSNLDKLSNEIAPLPDNRPQQQLLNQMRCTVQDVANMAHAIFDYDAKN